MSFGDFKYFEAVQPSISGSVIRNNNKKEMKFYTTALSASIGNSFSSSFVNTDTDYLLEDTEARVRSYFAGVKNTPLTTIDGGPPIEITLTSPTRLVKTAPGESSLDTGEGTVARFKPKRRKKRKKVQFGRRKFKPRNANQAVGDAEEQKGGLLSALEIQRAIKEFKLAAGIAGIKKKKRGRRGKKKKRKPKRL